MRLSDVSDILLWSALINYAVLLFWFFIFVLARQPLYRLHGRWFRLSEAQFDRLHYGLMGAYKLGILLFNLVPYIALRLVAG